MACFHVQEGVKVGQKLLAVSTPMPSGSGGELLNVTERSSLRFVKDAIRMNRSGNVSIVLSRLPINMSPEESEGAISSFLESVAGDQLCSQQILNSVNIFNSGNILSKQINA